MLHESGEYISSLTPIITANHNDPQKHGSGLSYARRYSLQSICNIGAEDDDANKATPTKKEYTPAQLLPYQNKLQRATDYATLAEAWVNIPNEIKPPLEALKNQIKDKLNASNTPV